jgi:hypothetical protein
MSWTHGGAVIGALTGFIVELLAVQSGKADGIADLDFASKALLGGFFGMMVGSPTGILVGAFRGKALPFKEIITGLVAGAVIGALQWAVFVPIGDLVCGPLIGLPTGAIIGSVSVQTRRDESRP